MDQIRVRGGNALRGSIAISGAKNATLPLMVASLLTDETLTLVNIPHLADIVTLSALLVQHGVTVSLDGPDRRTINLTAATIENTTAPYDLVRKMRASILVLGPLVARCGVARVSLPGGCAIGARPVDLHLKGLSQLGAEIELSEGYVTAHAPNGLTGARIVFPQVSVGATETLLMAATLARGETVLINAAREPEVVDLAHCLIKMGARIEGVGGDTLTIAGVNRLGGAVHPVIADRIEAGTYAMAAAITGGALELIHAGRETLAACTGKLLECGMRIQETERGLLVAHTGEPLVGVDCMTEPFPGFPTDLQAQFMTLMTIAEGASMITETVFENRFMHVPELMRMGANINIHNHSAMVRGVKHLTGAPVMATDLRASVSLVLAGLAAQGETLINRVYHLDRGYERIEDKLGACGADIERVRVSS